MAAAADESTACRSSRRAGWKIRCRSTGADQADRGAARSPGQARAAAVPQAAELRCAPSGAGARRPSIRWRLVIGWTAGRDRLRRGDDRARRGLRIWLVKVARRQVAPALPSVLPDAGRRRAAAPSRATVWAKANLERGKLEVQARREQRRPGGRGEIHADHGRDRGAADPGHPRRRREVPGTPARDRRPARRGDATGRRTLSPPPRRARGAVRARIEAARRRATAASKEATERAHDDAWNALAERWRSGLAEVQATVDEIHQEEARCFFDWTGATSSNWQYPTPTFVPPGLRFGEFVIAHEPDPQRRPPGRTAQGHGTARVRPARAPAVPDPGLAPAQGRRHRRQGRGDPAAPGDDAPLPDLGRRRARSGSRSSTRSAWARTSPPSCTWPTTTSCWSPAASGPRRRTSSSAWPTSRSTWRT